jgi:hypothetical protein
MKQVTLVKSMDDINLSLVKKKKKKKLQHQLIYNVERSNLERRKYKSFRNSPEYCII